MSAAAAAEVADLVARYIDPPHPDRLIIDSPAALEDLRRAVEGDLGRFGRGILVLVGAVGSLLIFGGEVLRGFTFAMIWGILIGTYSSIFVAAPFLLATGVKRDWSKEAVAATP